MLAGATKREIFQGRLLFPKWSLDSALCSFYSQGLQEKRNIKGAFRCCDSRDSVLDGSSSLGEGPYFYELHEERKHAI